MLRRHPGELMEIMELRSEVRGGTEEEEDRLTWSVYGQRNRNLLATLFQISKS